MCTLYGHCLAFRAGEIDDNRPHRKPSGISGSKDEPLASLIGAATVNTIP